MDSPSSDTVQTLLVQSQFSLFLFLHKCHLQQRGDKQSRSSACVILVKKFNLQEWYPSVNTEENKIKTPEASAQLCLSLPTSVLCPFQELLETRLSIRGDTKSCWSLTNSTQDLSHKHTAAVPHRYQPHTGGEHSRDLKEDRLGHCDSRTQVRSSTGNLSVWRRSLWSWEENTSKSSWVLPGRWGRMQTLQVPGKTSKSFCQLCPP